MLSYSDFWEKLSTVYPISKGEFKLPIATQLLEIENINPQKLFDNVQEIFYQVRESIKGENDISEINGIVRFDCVLNEEGDIKVLELNTINPDGLLLHDYTYGILKDKNPAKVHLNNYLPFFNKEQNIFILHPNASFLDSFYLEKKVLEERGYKVEIGTREDINFDKEISYNNKRIDIIRSCMDANWYKPGQFQYIQNTKIELINSRELRKLGNKSLLSTIQHSYIPKTLPLDSSLLDILYLGKDKWIIKPVSGSEGFGIYLGTEYSQEERENVVKENVENNYIAQEFVSIQKKNISFYLDGDVVEKELYFDFCPHLFIKNGEVFGNGLVLMRFSENKIVNVAQGGGIGYLKLD